MNGRGSAARLTVLTMAGLRQQILEWAGSWWFMATLVVQAAVAPVIGLFVWSAVYPNDPYVTTYYTALLLVTLMTESFEQHTFSERIYDGTIAHELLRPQPILVGVIGTNLAIRCWLTILGVPLVLTAGLAAGARLSWLALLMAVPAVVFAGALTFAYTFLLSLSAFWTQRVHAIVGFGSYVTAVLGGTVAPLAFLPAPWGTIGEFLPFYSMIGFGADVIAGRLNEPGALASGFAVQLGWLGLIAVVAGVLWRAGNRRYTVVGG